MPITKKGPYTYHVNINITHDAPEVVVEIGAYCSIAANLTINGFSQHVMSHVSTYPFHEMWGIGPRTARYRGHTIIGNDVWISSDVLITGGVTIGTGAVIGARSVVTRDVPPYAVVVGAPARVVRMRFPPHVVDALLASEWWTLSREQLTPFIEDLSTDDEAVICEFAAKAKALVAASRCEAPAPE